MRKMAFLLVLVVCWAAAERAAGEEATYVGVKKCKTCHIKVYQTWKETKHALAFDKLNEQEKQDPKCNECHVTGNDVNLPGIQCEACHGPGEKHVAEPEAKGQGYIIGLTRECSSCVVEQICRRCHSSEDDPDFDFQKQLLKVRHGS